jgi:hypothetical protein
MHPLGNRPANLKRDMKTLICLLIFLTNIRADTIKFFGKDIHLDIGGRLAEESYSDTIILLSTENTINEINFSVDFINPVDNLSLEISSVWNIPITYWGIDYIKTFKASELGWNFYPEFSTLNINDQGILGFSFKDVDNAPLCIVVQNITFESGVQIEPMFETFQFSRFSAMIMEPVPEGDSGGYFVWAVLGVLGLYSLRQKRYEQDRLSTEGTPPGQSPAV